MENSPIGIERHAGSENSQTDVSAICLKDAPDYAFLVQTCPDHSSHPLRWRYQIASRYGKLSRGNPRMKLNRRHFLTGAMAVAGTNAFGRLRHFHPMLAAVSPSGLAADPRRPQYHLLPAANWMNDPNGPIFWNGNYHMCYQYNPNGAFWGDMHWGHAISPDMVHWRHLPVALAPTPGSADAAGCFSGTAVIDGERVAVLYTGVVSAPQSEATIRDGVNSLRESQCLVYASGADLTQWEKVSQPVIAAPPAGLDVTGFRDPSPWRHGDTWYMVVGSGVRGKGGAILLYRSGDLRHWEYLHFLTQGAGNGKNTANPVDSGDMWECPDFFPLGTKHVLIYSSQGKALWQVGEFDPENLVFHSEREGVLDHGSFYAPKTQLDAHRNRILWGWIPETRPLEEYKASGWAGMMSLPRVLTLDEQANLQIAVAPEVEKLRQKPQTLRISADEQQNHRQLAEVGIQNCCGEILCVVTPPAGPFILTLLADSNPAATPWLSVQYDPAQPAQIRLDEKTIPLSVGRPGSLELHFYIDGSVIETLINNHVAYTKRFYYPGSSAPQAKIRISGSAKDRAGLSLWQLTPISPDRLTT
jgi:beta-fructofuranosidase